MPYREIIIIKGVRPEAIRTTSGEIIIIKGVGLKVICIIPNEEIISEGFGQMREKQ